MHNRHLLWRAAFGPSLDNNGWVTGMDSRALFRQLVTDSAGDPQAIDINQPDLNRKPTDEAQKLQLRKAHRDAIRNLNLAWLEQMRGGVSQLREKAAFLWHGHFACRNLNSIFQQQLLETIRKNALGNFGDLLREVSKSAAMLQFLNNNQNRKGHPNENFAREVMELFTMGRGHYTEADIREAARAFTGWGGRRAGSIHIPSPAT